MGRSEKRRNRRVSFDVIVVDNLFKTLVFFLGRVLEGVDRWIDALSLSSATAECEMVFLDIVVVMLD